MNFSSGNKYIGDWKNSKREGKGTFTYTDGERYIGEWKDGNENGLGTQDYKNGSKYEGQWKDGKREGIGTFTYKDGTKKSGGWVNNEYIGGGCVYGNCVNGYGTYFYSDAKYVGEWIDGKEEGRGTLMLLTGEQLTGEFKEGNYVEIRNNSTNSNTFQNNNKIIGCVKGNCIDGYGIYNYDNGDSYTGQFKNSLKSGRGALTYSTGVEYLGEFLYDKPNGQGILITPGGNTKSGIWENGEFIK
jgi:hypothetical protein